MNRILKVVLTKTKRSMFCILKRALILLFFFSVSEVVVSQHLEKLPPLITQSANHDSGVAFLFTTLTNRFEPSVKDHYINSVQIADAVNPWPPRWFTGDTYYPPLQIKADSVKGIKHEYFYMDARVQGPYISFFKLGATAIKNSVLDDSQGYILFNQKMEAVDTVVTGNPRDLYWHDFRINDRGERLIDIKNTDTLDFRSVSGNRSDSAVISDIDVIQILDKHNRLIFSWKATDKLDPLVFQYKEALKKRSFVKLRSEEEAIDWSHLTTALWDFDGNILYAMRFIGIGKINRQDGSLMWHVNFKDLPLISGKDTLQWFFPHDLNLVHFDDTSAVYSLFSLGNGNQPACGVIFKEDRRTQQISLVKYFGPNKKIKGEGQGSFDYDFTTEDYVFSYGIYHSLTGQDSSLFEDEIEYGRGGRVFGIYQLPKNIMAYKAHKLENWPLPPRPEILIKGNVMEAMGEMHEWTWYKMWGAGNIHVAEVGKGKTFTPEPGCTYCVTGKYGAGYCVSLPVVAKKTAAVPVFLIAILGSILLTMAGIRFFGKKRS